MKRISHNENEIVRRTSGRTLNPSSVIPSGLGFGGGGTDDVEGDGGEGDGGDGGPNLPFLNAPTNLEVCDQIVNTRPGGFTTVDVIICFDGVDGASGYEYRIAEVKEPETTT